MTYKLTVRWHHLFVTLKKGDKKMHTDLQIKGMIGLWVLFVDFILWVLATNASHNDEAVGPIPWVKTLLVLSASASQNDEAVVPIPWVNTLLVLNQKTKSRTRFWCPIFCAYPNKPTRPTKDRGTLNYKNQDSNEWDTFHIIQWTYPGWHVLYILHQ